MKIKKKRSKQNGKKWKLFTISAKQHFDLLQEKNFKNQATDQIAFEEFISSRTPEFCAKTINKIGTRFYKLWFKIYIF